VSALSVDASTLDAVAIEGFEFTLDRISVSGGHLQFAISTNEVWKVWCSLQTRLYSYDGGYSCCDIHTGNGYCSPDEAGASDLTRDAVCQNYAPRHDGCICAATSCTAPMRDDVGFDLQLQGDQLSGAVTGLAGLSDFTAFYLVSLTRAN
jgi:hypothetical protein